MCPHFQPDDDQPEPGPFREFRLRVVGLLAVPDPPRADLERALTDAAARRMLAPRGSRRFASRDMPGAQEAAELDALIVDLREALDRVTSGTRSLT